MNIKNINFEMNKPFAINKMLITMFMISTYYC